MTPFVLAEPPLLSRSTVDRSESTRLDTERQADLWSTARVLLVDEQGRTPVVDDEVMLRPAAAFGTVPPSDAVLLGEQGDHAYWAMQANRDDVDAYDDEHWRDLRGCGAGLNATDAGLFTSAVAVMGWHQNARYCAICGDPTRSGNAGWHRQCPGCGAEEYPRTDPAVIVLVYDQDDRHVLLARQPRWPPGRYSVLAGFVEAGESLESCVVREVGEEVGVTVGDVRYLGSQPWPFPRSLMLGFAAVADRHTPIQPADGEIAEARWVPREEVLAALSLDGWSRGDAEPSPEAGLLLPGEVSIARRMLEAWARVSLG